MKRHKQVHESTPGFIPIRPKEEPSVGAPSSSSSTSHHISPPIYHHHGAPITVVMTTASTPSLQGHQAANFIMSSSSSSPYAVDNNKNSTSTMIGTDDVVGYTKNKKSSDPAKFPCNKCSKVFTRKSHLTRHKMTHDQVKIYCDCGRLFRQKAHLHAHLPACKRKREAIEAKYLAEHQQGHQSSSSPSSSMVVNVRRSTPTPSPPFHGDVTDKDSDVIMTYDDSSTVINNDNNNNNSSRSNGDSGDQQQLQQHQQQPQHHIEDDNVGHNLPFNLKNLPVGLPPLIRDPI